jgi:glycogen(starch) synthase
LEQQVVQVNLTDRVELLGWVVPDEVPALLNTASLVLIPSRQESFGLVALEAAWMARPVVATCVGGLPEVVVHQQTGWLVEPENSQALAEVIAFLLDHPQRATRMGQAARRRAQEVFGFQRQVDAYSALYQQLNRRTRS